MAEKKLKKLSKKRESEDRGTAKQIMDSANQIWLAGLGAFAKAQEEGGKIFDTLVREGKDLEKKTRNVTTARIHEVRGAVEETVSDVQTKAARSFDKLETLFEDRVAKALGALGVPTSSDVKELTARIEELQKAVDAYSAAKAAPAKPAAKKTVARKTVAKKTTAKKAPAKKTASKPAARKASSKKS